MMKRSLQSGILFLALILTVSWGKAAQTPAPAEYVVDLSKSDNLKTIFDAGVRPWRMPGLEDDSCMLENINVKFLLPEELGFSLQTDVFVIKVLEGNQLARFDITCKTKSFAESGSDIRKVCKDLGISTDGLDLFLAGKGGLGWRGTKQINKMNIDIMIESEPSVSGPAAALSCDIEWNIPDSSMRFLSSPIQPPAGYENVSMDPPPRNPNARQVPEHDTQYYQDQTSQMIKQHSTGTAAPQASNSPPKPASNATPTITPKPSTPQLASTSPWNSSKTGWLALIIIFIALLIAYANKRK